MGARIAVIALLAALALPLCAGCEGFSAADDETTSAASDEPATAAPTTAFSYRSTGDAGTSLAGADEYEALKAFLARVEDSYAYVDGYVAVVLAHGGGGGTGTAVIKDQTSLGDVIDAYGALSAAAGRLTYGTAAHEDALVSVVRDICTEGALLADLIVLNTPESNRKDDIALHRRNIQALQDNYAAEHGRLARALKEQEAAFEPTPEPSA
jgi:hypothetical protein